MPEPRWTVCWTDCLGNDLEKSVSRLVGQSVLHRRVVAMFRLAYVALPLICESQSPSPRKKKPATHMENVTRNVPKLSS